MSRVLRRGCCEGKAAKEARERMGHREHMTRNAYHMCACVCDQVARRVARLDSSQMQLPAAPRRDLRIIAAV